MSRLLLLLVASAAAAELRPLLPPSVAPEVVYPGTGVVFDAAAARARSAWARQYPPAVASVAQRVVDFIEWRVPWRDVCANVTWEPREARHSPDLAAAADHPTEIADALASLGYELVAWSTDAREWDCDPCNELARRAGSACRASERRTCTTEVPRLRVCWAAAAPAPE